MPKYILQILFFALCLPLAIQARQIPMPLNSDDRIKVVKYDPNDVVEITTNYGYATTIVLEKDEYITLDGGMGKSAGWEVVSKPHTNFVIVKPKYSDNTTNLNFQTNKSRTYSFILRTSELDDSPTIMVRFLYPKSIVKSPFAERNINYQTIKGFDNPRHVNWGYSFIGDKTIAPVVAKDNGTFTVLKFKKDAPIPAILAVDPQTRKESLVNFRVQGDFVVVEGVFPQFTLRYGSHVTCLFNDAKLAQMYGAITNPHHRIKMLPKISRFIPKKPSQETK